MMKICTMLLVLTMSLGRCLAQAPDPPGEDWPVFLGPRGDGTSSETGLLKVWPEKGPPRVWACRVGNAYSAPVTSRGKLVFFHRVGDEEIVQCVNSRNGEEIWKYAYPSHYEDTYGYNNGPRSSPAIDGENVYTYGAEGVLTCLELNTGKLVWQRPVNKEFNVPQGFFGAGTAPVMDGDLVLVNVGSTDGASIVAFNKQTGATVWKTGRDEASYSTGVVRTINGRRSGIFLTREGLRVVDAKTGGELYSYPFRSKTHESVNAATPIVQDDMIFLSATYNVGAALLKLEPSGVKEIWRSRTAMQNHWATSILAGGFLYGMDGRHESGSNFRCIEWMTGNVRWTADEGLGRSAFIMADGHLIALGERGDLALIEVNPEKYVETSRV
ncbi:PQQ-like beta-propeller repeat protein, partial [Candidatus Sumerlaeota bacterium]|nr:PQQ-like beta-propeller repeat protein [Candidatus Sumerlaeota bacterium]